MPTTIDNLLSRMTLEEKIGYTFRDRTLLENALTHSSYANEHRGGLAR